MRLFFGICLCLITWSLPAAATERRCGWFAHPTASDLLLIDRHGTWWIAGDGRPDATGIDRLPQTGDESNFIETGVPGSGHGYTCACLTVDTSARTQRITRVVSGKIVPLARCRNDDALVDQAN